MDLLDIESGLSADLTQLPMALSSMDGTVPALRAATFFIDRVFERYRGLAPICLQSGFRRRRTSFLSIILGWGENVGEVYLGIDAGSFFQPLDQPGHQTDAPIIRD